MYFGAYYALSAPVFTVEKVWPQKLTFRSKSNPLLSAKPKFGHFCLRYVFSRLRKRKAGWGEEGCELTPEKSRWQL